MDSEIIIVDYQAGNLTSVLRALAALGFKARITADPEEVARAERVIFPGVGAAGSAMADLRATGMAEAITEFYSGGGPLLGICLGTQIVMEHSLEDGGVDCLGLLPGTVERFPRKFEGRRLKVPHMGWNRLESVNRSHPVLAGGWDDPEYEYYFVHAYYPRPKGESDVLAVTSHGGVVFPSMVGRGNLLATQFHLEKSGRPGLNLLDAFCRWDGKGAL